MLSGNRNEIKFRFIRWRKVFIEDWRSKTTQRKRSGPQEHSHGLTCACQSSWTPCSGAADDAGSSCGASSTASQAYGRWLYPFSYLWRPIRQVSHVPANTVCQSACKISSQAEHSFELTNSHVPSLATGQSVLAATCPRVDSNRFADDETILHQFTDLLTWNKQKHMNSRDATLHA